MSVPKEMTTPSNDNNKFVHAPNLANKHQGLYKLGLHILYERKHAGKNFGYWTVQIMVIDRQDGHKQLYLGREITMPDNPSHLNDIIHKAKKVATDVLKHNLELQGVKVDDEQIIFII